MRVGYARISTGSQNIQMQIDALQQAGCKTIFQEIQSGANQQRTEMQNCLRYLRDGDTLVVWAIDRLARTKKESDMILSFLKEHKINLISLKENIDSSEPVGELVLNILIAVAQSERERSIERTRSGLESARARGRFGGRPHKIPLKMRKAIYKLYKSKEYSLKEISGMYNISHLTVYRYIKEIEGMKK